MFDDELDESLSRSGSGTRWLLYSLVGVFLAGTIFFLFWQLYPWRSAGVAVVSVTPTAAVSGSTSGKEGQPDPPIYWQTIEENIARGLHLSVAQVKARLQPLPGQRDSPGIAHVASEQGISEAQLRPIEIDAIQKGHDLLVRMNVLTLQGSNQGMQTIMHWDQATLDDHVTSWFLND